MFLIKFMKYVYKTWHIINQDILWILTLIGIRGSDLRNILKTDN